ncbi:MAG: NAD(P)H-dependent oxidoreductase [Desulfoplanes sp.]
MKCDTAQLIFFSPTKTTMKIVDAIGEGMKLSTPLSRIDLTFPLDTVPQGQASDVAVIGTPGYAGRVPALVVDRLRQNVQGKGRPAVLVVVYGNRAYEDALLELRNVAEELGFVPVGAAAFIGEHSFSTAELPVAAGRPDADDLKKARDFGSRIREKMQACGALDQLPLLQHTGNFP